MKKFMSGLLASSLLCLSVTVARAGATDPIDAPPPVFIAGPEGSGAAISFNLYQRPLIAPSWASADVKAAWAAGYLGFGSTVTVVDSYNSALLRGRLNDDAAFSYATHGAWTSSQVSILAPQSVVLSARWGNDPVLLGPGLNIMNLSYGMIGTAGQAGLYLGTQNQSLINMANAGSAIIVKAAGNDNAPVAGVTSAGKSDYLNLALKSGLSAVFVGALYDNGTTERKTVKTSYSNFAGSDLDVQKRMLFVGVRGDLTNLYGTSFAAPIVSGYAAILGSKFTSATPTTIANQLLATARTDTIAFYDPSIYGKGEASLSRALAPVTIR